MENNYQKAEWGNIANNGYSNYNDSFFSSSLPVPVWEWKIPVPVPVAFEDGDEIKESGGGAGGVGGGSSKSTTSSGVSKSHSQAEKRRRDRINGHLSTLRNLLPNSHHKMEKAALLASVIQQVKDLKAKATEITSTFNNTLPTEFDEVIVDHHRAHNDDNNNNNNILIKASICCEDQPEFFSEIIQVLKGLRLTVVRADIATVGGRIKSLLVLCDNKDNGKEMIDLSNLKRSLDLILNRMTCSSSTSSFASNYRIRSKRQRLFFPSHFA